MTTRADGKCRRRERACPKRSFVAASLSRVALLGLVFPLPLDSSTLLAAMSGFDAERTYSLRTNRPLTKPLDTSIDLPSNTEKLLLGFLLQYRVANDFIYRFVLSIRVQFWLCLSHRHSVTSYARTSSSSSIRSRSTFAMLVCITTS